MCTMKKYAATLAATLFITSLAPASMLHDQLLAPDASAGDRFGQSTAIDRDTLVIGAHLDDHSEFVDVGSAYVYKRSGTEWIFEQQLIPENPIGDREWIGMRVAIENDIIALGAPTQHNNPNGNGRVYVFRYDYGMNQWVEDAILEASDGEWNDQFGEWIDISNNVIVVGAYFDDDVAENAGAAYVFRYDACTGNWGEEAKITASDGENSDFFGISVDIDGDVIAVGASYDDEFDNGDGSVYVFRYDHCSDQWLEEAKLLRAAGGSYNDHLGHAVAVSENVIIAGVPEDDEAGSGAGAAIVYRFDGQQWNEEAKLMGSIASAGDNAFWVDIDRDSAILGAYRSDIVGTDVGAAFTYRYNRLEQTWVETEVLIPPAGDFAGYFGTGVSVDRETFVVGATLSDDMGSSSGSTYVFGPSPCGPTDLTGDGMVDINDIFAILGMWGACP